jgi:hypothetical protein
MKYQTKQPKGKMVYYTQICIRCGKRKTYLHRSGLLPRPNTTLQIPTGNRFSCLLGSHLYYFEDEVEPVE